MDYTALPSRDSIEKTAQNLKERNVEAVILETKADALEKIKQLIPAGASVMNGSSRTLEEIGFIDYLKSDTHGWKNLHADIVAETDPIKQAQLRKQAVLSDFYLGSVHALAETGEFIIASNTGSQLPHIVFTSPNLIFVVGTQKITPSLDEASRRVQNHVVPLEDARAMVAYKVHTRLSKELIFSYENPVMGRKVYLLLVNEKLGF